MSDTLPYGQLISTMLSGALGGANGPLQYFYNMLYGFGNEMGQFHPDINGYTLMFMLPPHLSGYGYSADFSGPLGSFCKMVCFLGVDFTPPSVQVTASELPTHTGALPFGMQVNPTGQLSISYIDDQQSHIFGFHKVWVSYMEDILRGMKSSDNGEIKPSSEYYSDPTDPKFGEIDYMTSAYVIRTKPTRGLLFDDINYVGKATGIFPLNLPDKEVIGRRDSNEIVTVPMSYRCAWYRAYSLGTPKRDKDIYLLSEFYNLIESVYTSASSSTPIWSGWYNSSDYSDSSSS